MAEEKNVGNILLILCIIINKTFKSFMSWRIHYDYFLDFVNIKGMLSFLTCMAWQMEVLP